MGQRRGVSSAPLLGPSCCSTGCGEFIGTLGFSGLLQHTIAGVYYSTYLIRLRYGGTLHVWDIAWAQNSIPQAKE